MVDASVPGQHATVFISTIVSFLHAHRFVPALSAKIVRLTLFPVQIVSRNFICPFPQAFNFKFREPDPVLNVRLEILSDVLVFL